MRMSVLLPLCLLFAAPAHARRVHGITGIHVDVVSPLGQSIKYNEPPNLPDSNRGLHCYRAKPLDQAVTVVEKALA